MSLIETDTIKLGETYKLVTEALDDNDQPIVMDNSWKAAFRFTRRALGGREVAKGDMTIVDGSATASVATTGEVWKVGLYVYDVRLTDPEGNHFWSNPIQLMVEDRNTETPPAP